MITLLKLLELRGQMKQSHGGNELQEMMPLGDWENTGNAWKIENKSPMSMFRNAAQALHTGLLIYWMFNWICLTTYMSQGLKHVIKNWRNCVWWQDLPKCNTRFWWCLTGFWIVCEFFWKKANRIQCGHWGAKTVLQNPDIEARQLVKTFGAGSPNAVA